MSGRRIRAEEATRERKTGWEGGYTAEEGRATHCYWDFMGEHVCVCVCVCVFECVCVGGVGENDGS